MHSTTDFQLARLFALLFGRMVGPADSQEKESDSTEETIAQPADWRLDQQAA